MGVRHLQHRPSEGLDQIQHCSHYSDCSQRVWHLGWHRFSEALGPSLGEGLDGARSCLLSAASPELLLSGNVSKSFHSSFVSLLFPYLSKTQLSWDDLQHGRDRPVFQKFDAFLQRIWAPGSEHPSASFAFFQGHGTSTKWRASFARYVCGGAASGGCGWLAFLIRTPGQASPWWRSLESGVQHHLWHICGVLIWFDVVLICFLFWFFVDATSSFWS